MQSDVNTGAEGWLEMHVFGQIHRVDAVVANLEHDDVGFSFRIATPEDTQTLRNLVSEVGGLSWVD